MESKKGKRRSILINPRFQWTLVGYATGVSALLPGVIYLLISYGFDQFVRVGTELGLPPDHVYFEFLRMQEGTFKQVILAIAILVGLILILGGLFVSHKIAGPIYRMQKELNLMSSSEPVKLHEIHFRRGDFFPELAESFNRLVKSSKERRENE